MNSRKSWIVCFITITLLSCLSAACTSVRVPSATFHTIAMSNSGQGVFDYQVRYGDVLLRGVDGNPDPEFPSMSSSDYLGDLTVPEEMVVEWTLPSQEKKEFHVPLRSKIMSPNQFHGVVYIYTQDEHLGVFVSYDTKQGPKDAAEVFSTSSAIKRF